MHRTMINRREYVVQLLIHILTSLRLQSFPSQHTVNVVGNAPPSPQQAFLSRILLMFGVLMIVVFLLH